MATEECRCRPRARLRPKRSDSRPAEMTKTVEVIGERFFQMILDTASGKKSKSELHGYGQNEFVPWYLGAVM